MAWATVSFNPEHDAAAIAWDRRPNDLPLDAVNHCLAQLYRDDAGPTETGDLAPYLYEVYNGEDCLGMLVAGNFNPESDAEIRALFDSIIYSNDHAPQSGVWEAKKIQV